MRRLVGCLRDIISASLSIFLAGDEISSNGFLAPKDGFLKRSFLWLVVLCALSDNELEEDGDEKCDEDGDENDE